MTMSDNTQATQAIPHQDDPGALPETPQHGDATRLEESQGELETEEDPRLNHETDSGTEAARTPGTDASA